LILVVPTLEFSLDVGALDHQETVFTTFQTYLLVYALNELHSRVVVSQELGPGLALAPPDWMKEIRLLSRQSCEDRFES